MRPISNMVLDLLFTLEEGPVWFNTTQNSAARPDVHPSTLRNAKQRRLVREMARRGAPSPGVRLALTAKGKRTLDAN